MIFQFPTLNYQTLSEAPIAIPRVGQAGGPGRLHQGSRALRHVLTDLTDGWGPQEMVKVVEKKIYHGDLEIVSLKLKYH